MNVIKPAVDIGLLVHDIEAMMHFYCDLLGFPAVEKRVISDRIQHRIQIGETLLKLYELRDASPAPASAGRDAQAGFRYLTIEVDDARSAAGELEARGVALVAPPRPNSTGDTVATITDPEGNTIELFSRGPA